MRDLELYRLTPLFWFDDSLSNRKNLIIEYHTRDSFFIEGRNDTYMQNVESCRGCEMFFG